MILVFQMPSSAKPTVQDKLSQTALESKSLVRG